MGGKDAASARYIFTAMCKITRAIFPEDDDHVLKYLDDDGKVRVSLRCSVRSLTVRRAAH
jgi:hypothetical protein